MARKKTIIKWATSIKKFFRDWEDIKYGLELESIEQGVKERHEAQVDIANKINGDKHEKGKGWEIAATDLYVEKIERILTSRSKTLYRWGILVALTVVTILFAATFGIYFLDPTQMLHGTKVTDIYYLIIYIIKASSLAGLIAGCVYYLASLSKALFHEATVVLSRRQALRYGRLYVHLNKNNLGTNQADLEKAFKSTEPFTTAFKDMDIKILHDSQLKKINETIALTIKAALDKNDNNNKK